MRRPIATTGIALILLASGLVTASTLEPLLQGLNAPNVWVVEPVSFSGITWNDFGLAVDHAGRTRIAFSDSDGEFPPAIQIGTREAATWSIEMIARGLQPDLDSIGLAHVSFVRHRGFMDQDLVHATQTSTGWTFENVDTGGIGYTHIAVDTNDAVHIVYKHISSPYGIRYAVQSGGGWMLESVVSTPLDIAEFDMAIGPDNQPRILWTTTPGEMTVMTRSPGGVWSSEPVDTVHGFNPSLAVDKQGQPHAVYVTDQGKVKYAMKKMSGWNFEVVETSNGNHAPAIDLDGAERPHLIWGSDPIASGNTRYATLHDNVWQKESVNQNNGPSCYNCAITIDDEGFPRIVYGQFEYDPPNVLGSFDLYYAEPLLRAILPTGALP